MKATLSPEISKDFLDELPADLKFPDLRKAIPSCERALADAQKKSGDQRLNADAVKSLKAVQTAVSKAIKECDSKKHKGCITVLKKFDPLIKDEMAALQSKQADADGEDEPDDDNLSGTAHIKKMMKLMRSTGKELYFALGLNTSQPEVTTLLLSRKKKSEQLFKLLKRKNSKENLKLTNKQLMCGKAKVDPESKKTLYLDLERGEHPQLMEKGKKWLRSDDNLLFKRLKYRCNGRTFEDAEPDTDGQQPAGGDKAGGGTANLSRQAATAETFIKLWDTALDTVSNQVAKLRSAMTGFDDPEVRKIDKELGGMLDKFPKPNFAQLVNAAKANDRPAYAQAVKQTAAQIREVRERLDKQRLLRTIDENPFVKTNVHETVNKVLKAVETKLNG